MTLPVTLPVQPPPEGSEIKWSAELEILPLLVRWLDFTISNSCAGRCFPPVCIVVISVCLPCKPGCGGYADNSSGAVSCTGHGESILKVTLARLILSHMEQGSGDTLHGCILFLTNNQHAFFPPVSSQGNPRRRLHSWLCSTWASVCAAQEESSWCLLQDSGQLNLLQ